MPKLTPYLGFDGNCTEAMRFYEAALGGKIEMTLTFGESPMAEPVDEWGASSVLKAPKDLLNWLELP